MRDLQFGDVGTGVIYGFLREVQRVQDELLTPHVVFCFDGGYMTRSKLYPDYKQKRKKQRETPEQVETYREMDRQIKELRVWVLREMGYRNIFYKYGFEADDIIASICNNLPPGDSATIVTDDKDFYQLLSKYVRIWKLKTKRIYNDRKFREEWKLSPSQWADVKAIAGCSSDNIEGVPGVGDATAAKFLRNELKPSSKAYQSIVANNWIWTRNKQLVELPIDGVGSYWLRKDECTPRSIRTVLNKLGIQKL